MNVPEDLKKKIEDILRPIAERNMGGEVDIDMTLAESYEAGRGDGEIAAARRTLSTLGMLFINPD